MISQFLKTISRFTASRAGVAMALVCALGAAEAGAHHGESFDMLGNKQEGVLGPVGKHPISDDIVLADCGCDDAEDYGDDFSEAFDEGFDEGFGETYADDSDEDYGDVSGGNPTGSQGLTAEQYQRLNERMSHVTDRAIDVRLRALDVQIQGTYDYYGPAQ